MIWSRDKPVNSQVLQRRFLTAYRSGFSKVRDFVQAYATAFLRKVVVLLHVRHGIVFNSHVSSAPGSCELDRLTEVLRLPSLDLMFLLGPNEQIDGSMLNLVSDWIAHSQRGYDPSRGIPASQTLSLTHPTIFEMIGLPKNFDTLMEETMKRRCPTTGKDVSDPMLCLFCGEIFCAQSVCCLKEGPERPGGRPKQIGGAQQHMLYR
jgi:E3 ubiquitin-protein ligase UBR1